MGERPAVLEGVQPVVEPVEVAATANARTNDSSSSTNANCGRWAPGRPDGRQLAGRAAAVGHLWHFAVHRGEHFPDLRPTEVGRSPVGIEVVAGHRAVLPFGDRNKEHKIYPYLLRNVEITRPNQVWATDITYIRLAHGFMYLVAILDWHSRYVLSWRLSNSMEESFCIEALEEALAWQCPEIFNSDQGVQFTSKSFTSRLEDRRVAISMDGRGRVFDNIFIERLWRTVKYEDIYLKDYETVPELRHGLEDYFTFYCYERPHQSLDNRTPWEVYREVLTARERKDRDKSLVFARKKWEALF